MINNNEKYNHIVEQEKAILAQVRSNILANAGSIDKNFNKINCSLALIESTKDKIATIEKIKLAVATLLNKIAEADNIEELTSLRKDLNKEIAKVRTVLKKIENYDVAQNEELIKITRGNISKLYRNKSREAKLSQLKDLISREDSLTKEEKIALVRGLQNEKSYIKRNYMIVLDKDKKPVIIKSPESIIKKDNKPVTITIVGPKAKDIPTPKTSKIVFTPKESLDSIDSFKLSLPKETDNKKIPKIIFTPSTTEHSSLKKKDNKEIATDILKYMGRYHIQTPKEYGSNIVGNIVTFFKNIPVYKNNKKSLKQITQDYNKYSHHQMIEQLKEYLECKYSASEIANEVFNRNMEKHEQTAEEDFYSVIEYLQKNLIDSHKLVKKQAS